MGPSFKQRPGEHARATDRRGGTGAVGHINAESKLGDWTFGKVLLSRLTGRPMLSVSDLVMRPQGGLARRTGAVHYGEGKSTESEPESSD